MATGTDARGSVKDPITLPRLQGQEIRAGARGKSLWRHHFWWKWHLVVVAWLPRESMFRNTASPSLFSCNEMYTMQFIICFTENLFWLQFCVRWAKVKRYRRNHQERTLTATAWKQRSVFRTKFIGSPCYQGVFSNILSVCGRLFYFGKVLFRTEFSVVKGFCFLVVLVVSGGAAQHGTDSWEGLCLLICCFASFSEPSLLFHLLV